MIRLDFLKMNHYLTDGRLQQKYSRFLLEKKWKMKETDKDMILMLHEFEYELNERKHILQKQSDCKGRKSLRTAMAKTVGLPLGIAAKLILENKIVIILVCIFLLFRKFTNPF